ncbi:hypothetical protein TNIN_187411 [Trichonephila inaurata madagascariensis]|uniref:Uncharacterized protein n=1 Tax=Trichonephila inaurata madagascariensis TaxID=2747483 RepID=A0A8X6X3H7_9ARAC|nr:hypothetical protein TNIN_187411 [Trichonephila inaurata madagascariensis]
MLFLLTKQIEENAHSIIFCVPRPAVGGTKVPKSLSNVACVNCHSSTSPKSILPLVAQLILSESKLDGRFDHHQQLWNGLQKCLYIIAFCFK